MQRASERLALQLRTLSDEDLATAIPILFDENIAPSLYRQWRRWIRDEELPDEALLPMLLGSLWQPLLHETLTESLNSRQNLGGFNLAPAMINYLEQVEERATKLIPNVPESPKSPPVPPPQRSALPVGESLRDSH